MQTNTLLIQEDHEELIHITHEGQYNIQVKWKVYGEIYAPEHLSRSDMVDVSSYA